MRQAAALKAGRQAFIRGTTNGMSTVANAVELVEDDGEAANPARNANAALATA